jgi:phage terminase small subunit
MPRQRSPNRNKAEELYIKSNGSMKLVDIAAELGLKDSQIRKWKSEDKWDTKLKVTKKKNKKEQSKKNVTKKEVPKQQERPREETKKEEYLEIDELTERQRLFAEIFVRTPIAYKAAIKAGYSPDRAHATGYELVRNSKVKAYINYLKELKRESLMLEVEDLVDLNMRIAFADLKDYLQFGQERVPIMSKGAQLPT